MKINLDKDILSQYDLDVGQLLTLLVVNYQVSVKDSLTVLLEKNLIIPDYQNIGSFIFTPKGADLLQSVVIAADKEAVQKKNQYEDLAKELKEIFPKGKKPGTNYYWADGTALIIKRLQLFYKKYGNFTNEEILNATKAYVQSFNGNHQFMKLLKYFIFKEDVNKIGEVESTSELLSYIENKDEIVQKETDFFNIR